MLFFAHIRGFFLFSGLAACLSGPVQAEKIPEPQPVRPTTSEGRMIAEKIRTWFPDAPYMKYVANCESEGLIHRENGRLIRGRVDGLDEGVFQVRMPVHRDEMKKLGLNPNDIDQYFAYVRILYDKYGLKPWKSSKHCWSRYHRPQPQS